MTELIAYAHVVHGKWVANCPHPDCHNAEHFYDPYGGTFGGLTEDAYHCRERGGCRGSYRAVWPKNVREIDAILKLRPIMTTRNWLPGETLADLFDENMHHGIVQLPPIGEVPDGKVFQIVGNDVELGPAAVAGDVARYAIGGR